MRVAEHSPGQRGGGNVSCWARWAGGCGYECVTHWGGPPRTGRGVGVPPRWALSGERLLLKKEKRFLFSCTCRCCEGISINVKLTPSCLPPESHPLHPIVTPSGEAAVRGCAWVPGSIHTGGRVPQREEQSTLRVKNVLSERRKGFSTSSLSESFLGETQPVSSAASSPQPAPKAGWTSSESVRIFIKGFWSECC